MKRIFLIFIIGAVFLPRILAQTSNSSSDLNFCIPPLAIMQLVSDNPVSFNFPSVSVETIMPGSSKTTWINYSSIVAKGEANKIMVNISSGQLPESTKIKLNTGFDSGGGAGNVGLPTGDIILSGSPQDIITGIGSCYTGVGPFKGHKLTYSWIKDGQNKPDQNFICSAITLTYTILADL